MATFDQKKLKSTFVNRLKTQSRMSGDLNQKPWLPLRFLKKNYPNCVQKFINEIYEHLYIIVDYGPLKAKHILVKNIEILDIDNNGKVSCCEYGCSNSYTVLTSTILNRKVPMIFDPPIPANEALRHIVIDHVTPIDKTLRDLNSQLPELRKISAHIYQWKNNNNINKSGQALDRIAASSFPPCPSVNTIALRNELTMIANDSHYRLILASDNLSKSNLFEYKKIYEIKNQVEYIAVVEDKNVFDQNGNSAVIYQQLDNTQKPNLLVTSKTNFNNITTGASPCRLAQVPIDFL